MPLVSIIIPVYKVEKYLARCLDSVLAQSEPNFEVICVNDGSPDRSGEILADYAACDKRIKVLTQENKGQSAARNAGLDVATGDWIMFVDSDDWIPADALAGFLQVARESGAPVVVSATYAVDQFKAPLPRKLHWSLKKPALKHLVGKRKMQSSPWNKLFRADVLKNRRFIEGIYFEDWVYITEAIGDVDSFAQIEEPMYVYCTNGGDTSTIRSPFTLHKALSYRTAIAHARDYFKNHPMKKWGLKRADIAQKMLEKRLRCMVGVKSVSIRGGLGNQMFQYAFAKALAKRTGEGVLFDLSWFEKAKKTVVNEKGEKANGCVIRDFGLDAFPNVKLPLAYPEQLAMYYEKSTLPKFLRKLFKVPRYKYQVEEKNALKPCATDHLYVGYFQNAAYFNEVAEDVRADFAFPPLKNPALEKLLSQIKACENAVFVHIRRGDYVKLGWELKPDYYEKAISLMCEKVKNPTFFIFSDAEPQWIQENLKLSVPFEIVGNQNDMMDDMQLMSACRHAIVANSSFSWWAAWLTTLSPKKIVIAPSPWLPTVKDGAVICSDWVKVSVDNPRGGGGGKISIIMPVYNTGRLVIKSLDSLVAQTYSNIEIICVDDGSTDDTWDILKEYACQDFRVKVFHQENGGPGAGRNRGLDEASGDYIMFCDSDDWYAPTMCEEMVNAMTRQKCDAVMCRCCFEYEEQTKRIFDEAYYNPKKINSQCKFTNNVILWNKIFKKALIDQYQIRFLEHNPHDDNAFWFAYGLVANRLVYLKKVLYHYLIRKNSIMDEWSSGRINNVNARLDIMNSLCTFAERHDLLRENERCLARRFRAELAAEYERIPDDLLQTPITHVNDLFQRYFSHPFRIDKCSGRIVLFNLSKPRMVIYAGLMLFGLLSYLERNAKKRYRRRFEVYKRYLNYKLQKEGV